MNEIVALAVRLSLLKLHRLIAIDASHEIQQRATIVIHMGCPAKNGSGSWGPPAFGHFEKRLRKLPSVNIGGFKRRRTCSTAMATRRRDRGSKILKNTFAPSA
jgi:hypothetical protein